MRKTILTLALVATAMTTAASAQGDPATGGRAAPYRPAMRADADRHGIVTRAEAIAAADARFSQIDTDNDGRASPTEMRAYRAAVRDRMIARGGNVVDLPLHGERRDEWQDRRRGGRRHQLDGAGAGRGIGSVTRQEYEDRAARRFDRTDADHDAAEGAATKDSRRRSPGDATPVVPDAGPAV